MRNAKKNLLSKNIINTVSGLPYFRLSNLATLKIKSTYLKTILSRYKSNGNIFSLKKGFYVTKEYFDNNKLSEKFSFYPEFLINIIYEPSYLSLDYILYKENILTEIPNNFTAISLNKTAFFKNNFGNFFYHKIKKELFIGFKTEQIGNFQILKATPAKALFDFLYLRKNTLINKKSIEELRLNLDHFKKNEIAEFKKYIAIEGSKKMKFILNNLF